MSFASRVLARRRSTETRATEWGSSAIPSPLATQNGGSYSTVSLSHTESALQQVAVWSSADLIASVSSQLPIDTYRKMPDGTNNNIGNSKTINDPDGTGNGSQDWVYQYLMSKLLAGNAFGKQIFDPTTGLPTQTILYHPDDVDVWRDKNTGRIRWRICGKEVDDTTDLWHRRSYPMPGVLLGMSPTQVHVTTITLGIASTRFGAQFFSDGAHPSALLVNSEVPIDQKIAAEAKAKWMAAVYGSREPAVFGKGWEYKPISLKPDESQFLETNKYTSAQCARIFGPNVAEILGYETGGSMTYNNVEQRSIDFLKFTLNRWLRDLESTMSAWLPRGQFVKFNRAALLETDLLSRFKAYQFAIGAHVLAPSEARAYEDLPPMTDAQRKELETVPAQNPAKGEPK